MAPFAAFYAVPYFLGQVPSRIAELTVLLQALIPLTFAYAVSRYKLMDFEVLLKKAATLAFSYFVLACLYVVLSSRTQMSSENRLNVLILGLLAMVLGATLFSPLKKLFASLFDRVFYKRAYRYRKTLLSISKELNRERNLDKLSLSLLDLIANALSLENLALLLPETDDGRTLLRRQRPGRASPRCRRVSASTRLFTEAWSRTSSSPSRARPSAGSACRGRRSWRPRPRPFPAPPRGKEAHRLPGHGPEDRQLVS